METDRVALIRYAAPDGTPCVGSGLFIDERQVLTADHVADGNGHSVECFGRVRRVAEVLRSGTADVDLAVLTVDEPVTELGRLGYARVDRSRVARVSQCVAVGFPRWRKDLDTRRSAQVNGTIPTAEGLEPTADAGLRAMRLTLVGDRDPGAPLIPAGLLTDTQPASQWGGMSGAGVVASGLLVGVVRSHNLAAGGQSLTVTPLTAIAELPAGRARQFWDALGVADPGLLPTLPDAAAGAPGRIEELRGRGHRPDFTGRETDLARLHELLTGQDAAPVVLYGLGGVGKSQLAVEYAHAHQHELTVTWAVRGDNPSVLAADLAALGVQVGAADAHEPDIEVQLAAVRSWLTSHPRWLLLLDNVDDPAALPTVNRLLPSAAGGRVIVTSRISAWPGRYHRLEIGTLDVNAAARLLRMAATDTDEDAALRLADELDGLPLALQQAASYCRQKGKELSSYHVLFSDAKKRARLLAMTGDEGDATVGATWSLSFSQVQQSNPAGAALLNVLGYLAADPIPRTLPWTGPADGEGNGERSEPDSADAPAVTADSLAALEDLDDLAVDEALGVLHRFSLIQLGPDVIGVHRLVQEVVRASHTDGTRAACSRTAASWIWDALPELNRDAWPAYQALLPHALTAASHAASVTGAEDLAVNLLTVAGAYQRDRGLYAAARRTHEQALAVTEKAFPEDHARIIDALDILTSTLVSAGDPSVARTQAVRAVGTAEREFGPDDAKMLVPANNLGLVLLELGEPAEARPYVERALRIAEREFGPDHAKMLEPANNLGLVLQQLGHPAEARPYLERALRIAEREFGPDHPQALLPASNLGFVLLEVGEPAEARPYLERALRIAELKFGPDHAQVRMPASNLGLVLMQLGQPAEARPYLERALRITERDFGPDHAQARTPAGNLGLVLIELGQPAEARPYLERALRIAEREFGPDHAQTETPASNLGLVLLELGEPAEARPYVERALRIAEREFGPDHAQTRFAASNLGNILLELGQPDEARPYAERALRTAEREFGPDHAQTMTLADHLGLVLRRLGRPGEARPYMEQALRIAERDFGPEHDEALERADKLVTTLLQLGQPGEARPYVERALRVAERDFGPDHVQARLPANNLGLVLRQLGQPDEARPYLERALRIAEREFGPDHAQTAAAANNVGLVLLDLGRPDEAQPYLERALRITERESGPDHAEILEPASNLGLALLQLGQPDEAQPYLERALRITERESGPDDAKTLLPANNLGLVLLELGRPDEARPYLERALRIAEREFGAGYAEILEPASNLGLALLQLGRPDEAQPYAERALRIAEREFGADHAKTLLPANNLGLALLQLGQPDEAQPYLERALRIAEREFGPDHPRTLQPAGNLGETLRQLGQPDEALRYLERSLRIAEREFGPDHAKILEPANNLGLALLELGRPDEARPYLERALRIAEREFGPDRAQTRLPASNLAAVLMRMGQPGEARPYLERALRIAEREFGPDHPQTGAMVNNLGTALLELEQPAEARPYLERAARIAESAFGPGHPQVAVCLFQLAEAMRACNAPGEAVSQLERAVAIDEAFYGPLHAEVITDLRALAITLRAAGRPADAEVVLRRISAAGIEVHGEPEADLPAPASLPDTPPAPDRPQVAVVPQPMSDDLGREKSMGQGDSDSERGRALAVVTGLRLQARSALLALTLVGRRRRPPDRAFELYFTAARRLLAASVAYEQNWPGGSAVNADAAPLVQQLSIYADYLRADGNDEHAQQCSDEADDLRSRYLAAAVAGLTRGRAQHAADAGQFYEAVTGLEEARVAFAEAGETLDAAQTTLELANIYEWLGDLDRALEALRSVRDQLFGALASVPPAAPKMSSAISRALAAGKRGQAGRDGERALALRRVAHEIIQAEGRVNRLLGNLDEAERLLQQARAAAPSAEVVTAIDVQLADIACSRGDLDAAEALIARIAAKPGRPLPRPRGPSLRLLQADVQLARERPGDALELLDGGVHDPATDPDLEQVWMLQWRRGRALTLLGRSADALEAYDLGISVANSLRKAPQGYALDAPFMRDKLPMLHNAIDLAVERGDGAAAIRFIELIKARALSATLSVTGSPNGASDDEALFDEIGRRLDALEFTAWRSPIPESDQQRAVMFAERDRLLTRIRSHDPRWRAMTQPVPADIGALTARLGHSGRAVLVLYRRPFHVVAGVLDHDGVTVAAQLLRPDVEQQLRAFAENVRSAQDPHLNDLSGAMGITIADIVPAALAERAAAAATLIVIPHGILHLLPWPAMTFGNRRLFEQTAVGLLPNLASLPALDSPPASEPGVVLLGDPSYKAAQNDDGADQAGAELDDVAALYGSRMLATPSTGAKATAAEFWELAGRADAENAILHVACRGVPDAREPLESGLRLSGSTVDAASIVTRRVTTPEVVLSGCGTGWRPQTMDDLELAGDDALGLSASFLEAGARFVLVSVPKTHDGAARQLMLSWHRHRRDGLAPLAAFRAAQLDELDAAPEMAWAWAGVAAYGCQ